jgi:hypothetical protein
MFPYLSSRNAQRIVWACAALILGFFLICVGDSYRLFTADPAGWVAVGIVGALWFVGVTLLWVYLDTKVRPETVEEE